MQTLFIADLHLSPENPALLNQFDEFINTCAGSSHTQALYILGDLFEAWLGDDLLDLPNQEFIQHVCSMLSSLNIRFPDINLYFMHGNRDFLIGKKFAQYCNIGLLPDPVVINLYGNNTLLMHGDLLCSQDKSYQRWRKIMQLKMVQCALLSLPVKFKIRLADYFRRKSRQYTRAKSTITMDTDAETVKYYFKKYQVNQMIHGHTHRPAVHETDDNVSVQTRYVLPDWHGKGGMIRAVSGQKPELVLF